MNETQDSAIFLATFEAAVDAMIVSDNVGTIIRANPAACSMFQYEPSEMIGQNVKLLMNHSTAKQHDKYMSNFIDTGEKRIIGIGREVEGQRRDKTVFPLHLSVGDAEIEGTRFFVGILHDLTSRKATQDALARSQRLDAIGQMTGGIAHDFNNLLTVVIGNLELLEMRSENDKHLSLIKDALASAEMGADLTERLLVFARKSNLKPVETDLRELCEHTLAILKRTLGAPFRINSDFAPDLKPVLIDPVQFQSALMNLALNARDAMGTKGELYFSVSNVLIDDTYLAQETDIEQGEYVRLSVSDDGAGMDIEAQQRAFEPFFTTKTDGGGTGLGLAMVYGFVRQSGGHITVYSELNHGTSFGLYFPAIVDPHKSDSTSRVSPKKSNNRIPHGNGEVVLVVEDNPRVRKFSVERVRDLGFKTVEAESGDDAYKMLQDGVNADILFSDIVMPGSLNGYDLVAKVASEFPHMKVLLTSGYVSDTITEGLANNQVYEILHKPYRTFDLASRLQALLVEDSDD